MEPINPLAIITLIIIITPPLLFIAGFNRVKKPKNPNQTALAAYGL